MITCLVVVGTIGIVVVGIIAAVVGSGGGSVVGIGTKIVVSGTEGVVVSGSFTFFFVLAGFTFFVDSPSLIVVVGTGGSIVV